MTYNNNRSQIIYTHDTNNKTIRQKPYIQYMYIYIIYENKSEWTELLLPMNPSYALVSISERLYVQRYAATVKCVT